LPAKYIRALLLLYGMLNGALYSSLLPLWEGFDEEFHYSYVEYLEAHFRFPVLGQTGLSEEVNRSIDLLPMSYVMQQNLRVTGVRTFDQYYALDSATRHGLRDEVDRIPRELRAQESVRYHQNYDVHHGPLAYLLMAVPDRLLEGVGLLQRVWLLRLVIAMACTGLMFTATLALAREAGLKGIYAVLPVFLLFSCQMFWATVAHVCNDWLAVSLATWTVVLALRCHREATVGAAMKLGLVLALGLLTKAYFLLFAPLVLVVAIVWRRRLPWRGMAWLLGAPLLLAGPWYARNVVLYGNVSGRLEESSGVSTGAALHSLASIPWVESLPFMARGTFWMGNGSFTDFSVKTMDGVLLLLGMALVLAGIRRGIRDAFLWTPVVLFTAGMIYVAGSSYTFTGGAVAVASPWYLQAVMAPLLCLAMLGCQRLGTLGRWLSGVTVALWSYVLAATYVAKLFPLYGGFSGGRSTLREIAHWYLTDWARTSDILSTNSLLGSTGLVVLLGLLIATLIASLFCNCRSLCSVTSVDASDRR